MPKSPIGTTEILTTDFNPLPFPVHDNYHKKKEPLKINLTALFTKKKSYLLVPALIIAQRKPMVEVAES